MLGNLVALLSIFYVVSAAGLGIGDKVPDLKLPGLDGKSYALKDTLTGSRGAVLLFISTQCPYSNAYNDRYNVLAKELGVGPGKSVALLAINSNETESLDEIRTHAREKGFVFPVLKDAGSKVADLLGAERTPEAYFVGADGALLYHGRIDDDTDGKDVTSRDLKRAVDEYLSGKKVSVPQTKAFGCTIKRTSKGKK